MLSRNLAQFLLDVSPEQALQIAAPVLDAVLEHPEQGGAFLERLISAQDQRKPTATFWALWQAILDRLFAAIKQKTEAVKNRHLPKLLDKIFLGVNWKRDSRDWPPLEGEAYRGRGRVRLFRAAPGHHRALPWLPASDRFEASASGRARDARQSNRHKAGGRAPESLFGEVPGGNPRPVHLFGSQQA